MLTATRINAAKPKAKAYKLFDTLGLFLYISPAGGKLWRLKYRFSGHEKLLSFGAYPEISLVEAREKRDTARKLLATGIDPGEVKKTQKKAAESTGLRLFELVAREWHAKFIKKWSADYAAEIMERLERDVFPWIGNEPVAELVLNPPVPKKGSVPDALVDGGYKLPVFVSMLRRIESRGALESLRKAKIICGQVFRYSVACGDAERDPVPDLRGAFAAAEESHFAAITDPKEVGPLLRALDGYKGSHVVRCGLRLSPILLARPGEVRKMEWTEVDFDDALWTIPAEKMKMDRDHSVPLSRQAIQILREELWPLTGCGKYALPSIRSKMKPMSDNTINAALRTLGYNSDRMTAHGFRAMARTILDEVLSVRVEYIEHQLAHAVKDANGRAYNRTTHLDERRKMMQLWSDYLDGLKAGAKVLQFAKKVGSM